MTLRFRLWGFVGLVLLGIIAAQTLIHLVTESWWFESVGYAQVFWTRLGWQSVIAGSSFIGYWAVLWMQYHTAQRLTRDYTLTVPENRTWDPYIPGLIRYASLGMITLLAIRAALQGADAWETVLKFFNQVDFNQVDPIYQRNISFYIFRLPLYEQLHSGLLELLIWSLLIALAIYGLKGEIRPERGWKYFLTGAPKTHLCWLLAGLAGVIALGFWLARYQLLYSTSGVVFGAGYVDVHARLQAYTVMISITLALGAVFVAALWRSGFSLPVITLGLYGTAWMLLSVIYPALQQTLVVEPNELSKEAPYIAHNIELTRQAYGLTTVQTQPFSIAQRLEATQLNQNAATIKNIRLWDYRPLLETYTGLQTLRPYYHFQDVDIDRYVLNGDYRQVMLSARELRSADLPDQAQTWVNQRLTYTHGYGLVMSPVNQVTPAGLPTFFIKDLPPQRSVDLPLEQPRIYYGELTDPYIVTGTTQAEFDYPFGDANASNTYDGLGGVPVSNLGRRLAYAYELNSLQFLLSNYLTPQSRIHYYRTIQARIKHLAPFLSFDRDPYLAVIQGRLQWIVDGYTTSHRYPYAQPLNRSADVEVITRNPAIQPLLETGANYIRNSVKAVVDAYDGSVTFYRVDRNDPVLAAYGRIFPSLFTPLEQASAELRSHFRYPQTLFQIQAQLYLAYHMERPEVFYNQEDLWAFPTQVSREETEEPVEPYYVIMKLPQAKTEAFMLIQPFTPRRKNNMIAWMTALCDGEQYGQLLVYEFSKQSLIYGPRQVETRIDQNPEISEQLTLWNQQGSEVFRGNLLVFPIDHSLLYVEPVYLQATGGKQAIPELKRVIVAYDDEIAMAETLEGALNQIFGAPAAAPRPSPQQPALNQGARQQLEAALTAYEESQQALKAGDWKSYGEAQQRLGELLQQLNQAGQ